MWSDDVICCFAYWWHKWHQTAGCLQIFQRQRLSSAFQCCSYYTFFIIWVCILYLPFRKLCVLTTTVSVLTSAVMVLLSGVIKPKRPSLSTTAKPSRVTQYSIQRIYTPSRSREGPPTHTHTFRGLKCSVQEKD